MGAIWFTQSDFVQKVSEYVGYKSGLAVTPKQLRNHLPEQYRQFWDGDPQQVCRIRSEEFQELITDVLLSLGVEDPGYIPFFAPLADISRRDPDFAQMFEDIKAALPRFRKPGGKPEDLDVIALMNYADEKFGAGKFGIGAGELAIEMAFNPRSLETGPWGVCREIAWTDIRELDDLFNSENLSTFHGRYFDQRFIDYLSQNLESLGEIQWRQFEGMTAEYFQREGYTVELGPGRDDDNVDVRAWVNGNAGPPTILIQCKRQKAKVAKVVVKALYADIVHEKAESGMIVTTSSLEPGASALRTARGYPIEDADRAKVVQWIQEMRTKPAVA